MPKYLYEKVACGVVRRHKVNEAEAPAIPAKDNTLRTRSRFVLTVESTVHTKPQLALAESITMLDPREVRRPPDPVIGTTAKTIGFGTKLSKR